MMSKEILMVADAVSNEKGVSREVIFEAIESASGRAEVGELEVIASLSDTEYSPQEWMNFADAIKTAANIL